MLAPLDLLVTAHPVEQLSHWGYLSQLITQTRQHILAGVAAEAVLVLRLVVQLVFLMVRVAVEARVEARVDLFLARVLAVQAVVLVALALLVRGLVLAQEVVLVEAVVVL
jgi:hypothetical protein